MTIEEFTPIFIELATQLRATDADELVLHSYYQTLRELDLEFIEMAATRLAQQASWFPKTSEWRNAALTIAHERHEYQKELLRKLPQPLCPLCRDTGWSERPESRRYERCDCMTLRRQEVLGRRPWPTLPEPT